MSACHFLFLDPPSDVFEGHDPQNTNHPFHPYITSVDVPLSEGKLIPELNQNIISLSLILLSINITVIIIIILLLLLLKRCLNNNLYFLYSVYLSIDVL